jgi:GNAT superfamily N-acetyltransferase
VDIRLATEKDIDDIQLIYKESITEICSLLYSDEIVSQWSKSKTRVHRKEVISKNTLWVCLVEDKLLGFLVVTVGEIIALFVSPRSTGAGVGKALLSFGLDLAAPDKGEIIVESTLNAESFYQKYGFKVKTRSTFSHGDEGLNIPVVNMVYEGYITER